MTSTIIALASAPGRAGVAIVRISGPHAGEAFVRLGCVRPKPRKASLQQLKDGPEVIDHALLLWFPAPHSFTGEDVLELHLHGSMAVTKKIITTLSGMDNIRLAEPGEFARRAFMNGKMDLTQAEGLADLIDAETETQRRQALRQMEGELGALYDHWREELVTLLAHLEAYIDFPDEDLPPELEASLERQAGELVHMLTEHLADRRGERLREGIYVAIVGAPNVGKSSLINALSRRDIAIVSPEAGTTRDAIEAHFDIGGYAVTLCDTAGLREGAGAIEAEGIARARVRADKADIVLALFEAGAEPDTATLSLINDRTITVVTKSDLSTQDSAPRTKHFISTLNGDGLSELLATIGERAAAIAGEGTSPLLTRERHRAALTACCQALERFRNGKGQPIELRAQDLRDAAMTLGSITGRIRIEELMDKIFSSFCIGK